MATRKGKKKKSEIFADPVGSKLGKRLTDHHA